MYKQPTLPSQPKITHFQPISYAPRKEKRYCKTPEIPGVPVKAIEAILLCVDVQSIDSFVCTQKKLAKEYGCVKRTTTRLFKNMITAGFLDVVWEQNYSAGKLRVFKIGDAYKAEIEAYLSNFTPGDICVAECPPCYEIVDLAPVFSVSGLSFIEESEALAETLAETFEKKENLNLYECMYPVPSAPQFKLPVTSLSFETAKIYTDDYLGYFKDFNEKKRYVKLIGQAVDRSGVEFVDDLMRDLASSISDYPQRRVKLIDYLARMKLK